MTDDDAAESEDAAAADEQPATDETEPDAPDDEPEASDETEGLQDGAFVKVAYTMRTVDDGTLVDTTDVEIAEEEGVDTEDQEFGPQTIVLGAGHVFQPVEDEFRGKAVGATGSVEIPAAEAFGEHDPEEVRTVSADRLDEDNRHPGAHVTIDGQHGHVETVIGGRARVDFNHLLAGEDIEYEYEILDVVEERIEQARGLFDMYIEASDLEMSIETDEEEQTTTTEEGEEETETVELETLYLEATPQLAMNQQWLFQKQQIAQEVIERVGVDRIIIQEILDGGMGGLGGMLGGGGLEGAIEDADLDDVDADEIVDELEGELDDVDAEGAAIDEE